MDEKAPLVAGVELGGTKCVAVLARGFTILEEVRVATGEPDATLGALARQLASWRVRERPCALGIASFGPIVLDRGATDYGRLTTTPKPGWGGINLVARLGDGFGSAIALETDVNAAAMAEGRWGGARGLDTFAYLTIGTGIGGGLIANGRPLHGMLHPEIGHIAVRRSPGDDFAGICPVHGDCVEGLASGPAIAVRAGRAAERLPPDDPLWNQAGRDIGELLAVLVLAAAPQRILIGGGIGIGQPTVIAAARATMLERLAGYVIRSGTRIQIDNFISTAELGGRTGPLGAIALALALAGV